MIFDAFTISGIIVVFVFIAATVALKHCCNGQ